MITTPLDIYVKMAQHRRIGSTTFNIMGINFDRPAVFVFANMVQARQAFDDSLRLLESQGVKVPTGFVNRISMRLGPINFATVNQVFEPLRGVYNYKDMPISVDHFALTVMIQEDQKLKEKWIRESQTDRIFSVARKVHKDFDAKAVMKIRKQWDEAAEKHAEELRRKNIKAEWEF